MQVINLNLFLFNFLLFIYLLLITMEFSLIRPHNASIILFLSRPKDEKKVGILPAVQTYCSASCFLNNLSNKHHNLNL